MELPIEATIKGAWTLFMLYWLWGWRRVKGANRAEPLLPRLLKYWLPLAVAFCLLGSGDWFGDSFLHARIWLATAMVSVLGALLTVAGVAFACWARYILGRNWSSEVQLKQDQELIERGPYRLVRHPIYTGMLLAFFGTAMAIGEWRGLIALAIIAGSFWFKLRLEERWMREQFGAGYLEYMQRVKALIPWIL